MAISFLSSICNIATKLASTIQISPSSSSTSDSTMNRIKQDLENLQRTLNRIQAVLNDAEEREIRDESVKLWLRELKDVAYDAEDVLDEYQYELLRAQVESSESTRKRKREEEVCDLLSALLHLSIPERIREIRERFDDIAKHRDALHLREGDGPRRPDASMNPLLTTSSHVDVSGVFGRDQDRDKVVELLFSDESCRFSVVPIVGMGGLGKTTLAQLVYNDTRVRQHFDCMGWVCVSEKFDVERLTREIIESVTGKSCESIQLNALQDKLKGVLKEKRALVVLDDVWNDRQSYWESLRLPFVDAETVRFIVTTRNDSVAKVMQTMNPYRLGCLSKDECWLLFQKHAFDGRDPTEHPNLVKIGEKIVRKCDQLPLAVKVLGGLLRHEIEEDKWNDILQSVVWDLEETKNEILPALSLSYHRMPAHLKPCFLLSVLFPKGYRFKREELVNIWMAHGCIQPRGSKGVEDVGFEYFDELQRRSFFQLHSDLWLTVTRFQMHDMLHDLGCFISGNESQIIELSENMKECQLYNELRHLKVINIQKEKTPAGFPDIVRSRNLRTLDIRSNEIGIDLGHLLVNFGRLRVLGFNCQEFPGSVRSLKHLRYLRLHSSSRVILPESLCHLYNLQTLDLESCYFGVELPTKIGNLAKLRHLLLPRNACIPPEVAKLTDLHELNMFSVGINNWRCAGISSLQLLVNLSGRLKICRLENVVNTEEAEIASFKNKKRLQSLYLRWNGRYCAHRDFSKCTPSNDYLQDDESKDGERSIFVDSQLPKAILEKLQPHTNLTEFIIEGYTGTRFPSWLSDPSFSKLTTVSLIGPSEGCKHLPALGQIPLLKVLKIQFMAGIKRVGPEFSCCFADNTNISIATKVGFPSLEELYFGSLTNWEVWYGVADSDFPCLHKLTIMHCPKLRNIPSFQSLRSLQVNGCTSLNSLSLHQTHKCPSVLQALHISGCSCLTSIAGLYNLESLEKLTISNCSQFQFQKELLPSNLQTLKITGCNKLISVAWLRNQPSLKILELVSCLQLQLLPEDRLPSSLESIHIINCWKLTFVAGLQNLNSLKTLVLKRCFKLHLSPAEWLSSVVKHIEVSDCPGAKEWCQSQKLGYREEFLTPYQLTVSGIQEIIEKSEVDNLLSVEHLCIKGCRDSKLFIDKWVPSSVVTLQVCFCRCLQSISLHQNLSAIKSLTIRGCVKLSSVVNLQKLSSLRQLVICDCPSLQLLEDRLPSMLQSFVIHGCDKLMFLPLLHDNLIALQELKIWNCSKLTTVAGLENLTSLQTVTVKQCPKLRLLSSEKLFSKPHHVKIEDCPGLRKWCQGNGISYIQRFN